MVYAVTLDDRVIPYHPIEHRDSIHILKKLYYTPIFYPKDINSLNQARAHLWQEAFIYLSKTPQPNLPVKPIQLSNLFSRKEVKKRVKVKGYR
ncbi:MAG: hypothetical protein JRI72_12090 [Deltaproteobacteria bacterium]|nr:hypothetical protein [Deltaproteobacteria bacterium]